MIKYDNFIIIISAPSGAGKSTIVSKLLEWDESIKLSVSATTREPREGEVDGVNYRFMSKEEFEAEIEKDSFIEYAKVFENYYGTPLSEVERNFKNNNDVILDIDWQGARNVSNHFDSKRLLRIFILPPSIAELENRLKGRGTDSEEVIEHRMLKAKDEINHFNEYDFVIINDDLEKAMEEVKSVIITKRLQNIDQTALEDFVSNM
ncbi:MAG: guanylate kinase [Rickettsiales bacterium]|nr:guanylate kinase [Rickettsiales bacterium]